MALSFVEYQGDGITKVFAVPFDYIYRDDVKVTLNGQPATFSWLSPNSISLSTAPTSAQLLKIERDTEKQTALVDFKNDSVLDEALLDLMWKQVFMIIQEAQDQTDVSYGISDNARAIAAEAKGIAQTAETKASSAISTANGAVSTADTALSTANTATSTANQAVTTANNAVSSATSAQNTANSAVATANSAVSTANSAASQAGSATTTAHQAVSIANSAVTRADNAVALAMNAQESAGNAQNAANNAQIAAESAATDALTAQSAATSAEAAVREIKRDIDAIVGADFTDFAKNSENLSMLTDKAAAKANLGLDQVDNTSDLDKPISTATQSALEGKADSYHLHTRDQITDFTVSWAEVTGKPASYTPSAHTHGANDLPGSVKGLVAHYGSGQGDPNTAVDHILLSNHANTPNSAFYWHIYTSFYSSISSTANRSQLAIQYNGGNQVYARSCYGSTWTAWVRLDVGDWATLLNKPSEFPPSAHNHDWANILNPPTQATRWPTWNEVTSKPTTFPPSSHSHGASDIALAFSATGLQNLTEQGYQKFPGGLILQWGYLAINQSIAAWTNVGSITFPIAFPSRIIGWAAGWEHENSKAYGVTIQPTNLTTTGTGPLYGSDTGQAGTYAGKFWYMAAGV